MIPRIFEGETAFVVAGGPSLKGFSFDRLRGRNTIAINRAHEFLDDARVLWWSDARYWRKARETLMAHAAPYKATCQMQYDPADAVPAEVHVYQFSGLDGFDSRPGYLRHGNNGAYAALHLAAHLGARRIILLGVDMRHGRAGETHFHDGYEPMSKTMRETHEQNTLTRLMLPYFRTLVKPLAELGIEVLNASPESRLDCWPRVSIDEGLSRAA